MLYIVATPIGNLSDVSERMINTLKEVDFVLAEDTRVTRKLFERFDIKTALITYHHYTDDKKSDEIIQMLQNGKHLALVTDSGTPGVADPVGKLIERIKQKRIEVEIIPIPGPSALCAAVSVSGFYMNRFSFLGFPPAKRKRDKFFKEFSSYDHPIVFYESPYRILKTLNDILNHHPEAEVVVCRELTKIHEKIYRGKISEVINEIEKDKIKGEFTVIFKM